MVSLSMIVKNEEKNLRDCLKSVTGVVDEIVVVDTGSSDKTIDIAKEFDAKVYEFEWINDFAAVRNYSLSKCSGDYILYLDADERLAENSKALLQELTGSKNKRAYDCKILNIDEVNKRPSVMTYVRLFPLVDGISFTGKVHEQIEPSLRESNIEIHESSLEIIHTGYSTGKEQLKSKAERNLVILHKEFEECNSAYYAFHLGQTYNILEDTEKAQYYFETAVQEPKLKKEYKSTALRLLAVYESERNNLEQALTYINNAIYSDGDQPLNYMVAAQLYNKTGDREKELLFIIKALIINKNYINHSYKSSQTIFIDEYLIICTGIKAAIEAGDQERFNYFRKELITHSNNNPGIKEETDFLLQFIDGDYSAVTQAKLNKYVNETNLELIISLIKNTNDEEVSGIFNLIYHSFENNSFVIKEFAVYNLKKGDLEKAEKYLQRAINLKVHDPAVYFYLISVFLQKNKLEKLPGILDMIIERFEDNPAVLSQLNTLQQKLSQLV